MALFVVIPATGDIPKLDAAVAEKFGNRAMQLARGEWLIAYDGTSKQLSDEMKISDGDLGVNAVVLAFSGYYGRAPASVWEWISTNSGPLV